MRIDKQQRKIIKELCQKYNVTEEQALEIIKSPFRFIRSITKEIDLKKITDEESFEKETHNFNIPAIGKLYANFYNFKRWHKK